MTARLVPIEPEREIVGLDDMIESLREAAKDGTLSAAFVVLVRRDGTPDWFHTHIPSFGMMLGAIERAKYGLIREAEE